MDTSQGQGKARHDRTGWLQPGQTRQGKTRQDKVRQDKVRQGKARQDRTGRDRAGQDRVVAATQQRREIKGRMVVLRKEGRKEGQKEGRMVTSRKEG
jgi:hypothetical protein